MHLRMFKKFNTLKSDKILFQKCCLFNGNGQALAMDNCLIVMYNSRAISFAGTKICTKTFSKKKNEKQSFKRSLFKSTYHDCGT